MQSYHLYSTTLTLILFKLTIIIIKTTSARFIVPLLSLLISVGFRTQQCPDPSTIFNFTHADPSPETSITVTVGNSQLEGRGFTYKCQPGYLLFVSNNGVTFSKYEFGDSIRYQCLFEFGYSYNRSIEMNGWPRCGEDITGSSIANVTIIYSKAIYNFMQKFLY